MRLSAQGKTILHNMSTKDRPGTLPVNAYEDETVNTKIPWRSQAVPDEILENILQFTPNVRSAFLFYYVSSGSNVTRDVTDA